MVMSSTNPLSQHSPKCILQNSLLSGCPVERKHLDTAKTGQTRWLRVIWGDGKVHWWRQGSHCRIGSWPSLQFQLVSSSANPRDALDNIISRPKLNPITLSHALTHINRANDNTMNIFVFFLGEGIRWPEARTLWRQRAREGVYLGWELCLKHRKVLCKCLVMPWAPNCNT